MTNQRAAQVRRAGTPGPEGSVGKLAYAEENQRVYELCVDMLGADGMLFPSSYPMIRPELVGMSNPDPRKMFLRVRANSIEGEPQRSCATSWVSGSSASPATYEMTRISPGRMFPEADGHGPSSRAPAKHCNARVTCLSDLI